jgi:hypothetical protein
LTSHSPAQRIFVAALIVEAISVPVEYLIPSLSRLGDIGLLAGAVLFLIGMLLTTADTRRGGGSVALYPHGVLLVAWTIGIVALTVLLFGPQMSPALRTGVRYLIVACVALGLIAYWSAWSGARPDR